MSIVSEVILQFKSDTGGISKAITALKTLQSETAIAGNTARSNIEQTLAGFNRSILGIRTGLLETAGGFVLGNLINDATSAVISFGKSFIQVSSDIQQFKLSFKNIFQSVGEDAETAAHQAENAFAFAKKVAETTPFDLPEIATAIVRLETFGISVDRVLNRAIDLASALKIPLDQIIEAFTNLQSGRFGIAFREFAIAGIARDQLEGKGLVFDKSGEYQGSVEQAMAAVTSIIDEHFKGFAASQAGTFAQLQSNLRDVIFQLKGAFGQGFFNGVNADFKDFVDTLVSNQTQIEAFATAFGELFGGAEQQVSHSVRNIIKDVTDGVGTSTEDMFTFGVNLFKTFADGILQGAQFVLEAVTTVADGIAFFLESFSPPKGGPLKEIDAWGANLINTYLEGMKNADFSLLGDVLDIVKKEFDALSGAGIINTDTPKQDFLDFVDIVVNGFSDIEAGGASAQAVFDELAAKLGSSAADIQKFVQALQALNSAKSVLDAAESALSDFNKGATAAEGVLNDKLSDLKDADQKRRDIFDAEQEAAANAASAANDAASAANDAADAAVEAARKAAKDQLDAQIEGLQNQKDSLNNMADAAVDGVKAEEDAALKILDQQKDFLDESAKVAQRALEDFDFQTEGIPERFTRQRRRDLEAIATQRKREAEDGSKAIDKEKQQIKDNSDLKIKGIKDAAKLQSDAIDAEIKGLRDQESHLDDIYKKIQRNNNESFKKAKFVPDPHIAELEDELKKLKRNDDTERKAIQDRVDAAKAAYDAAKAQYDAINEQIKDQIKLLGFVKDAHDEEDRILKALAADMDKITNRTNSTFADPVDEFNKKLDEAREKLKNLITQEDRDKIKKDLQFFADFAEGLLGIKGPNTNLKSEGFLTGTQLKTDLGRIKDAFTENVLPIIKDIKDAFVFTAQAFNGLLNGIDRVKGIFADVLEFLGLDRVPILSTFIDLLNRPIKRDLATLGGFLLFLKFTPFLSTKLLFNIGFKLITTAGGPLMRLVLGLLGFGGAEGAGAAGAEGAAASGGLGAAIAPFIIPVLVVIALSLVITALATDFHGIRTKIFNFIKQFPEIATLIGGFAAPAAAPILIPVAIGFALKRFAGIVDTGNVTGALTGAVDSIKKFVSGLLLSLGGLSGDLGGGVIDQISSLLSGIQGLSRFVGGGFASAFSEGYRAFKPWIDAIRSLGTLTITAYLLPLRVFTDFIQTVFVPLFNVTAPLAIKGFQAVLSTFGSIAGGILSDFVNETSNLFSNVLVPAFNGLSSAFGEASTGIQSVINEVLIPAFTSWFGIITSASGIFSGIFGEIGTAIKTFIDEVIIPSFTGLITAISNIVSGIGGIFSGIFSGIFNDVVTEFTNLYNNIFIPIGVFFQTTLPNAISSFADTFNRILGSNVLNHPFSSLQDFLSGPFSNFVTTTLPGFFITAVQNIFNAFKNFGSDIIIGPFKAFTDFITNTFVPTLTTSLPNAASSFLNTLSTNVAGFVTNISRSITTFTGAVTGIPSQIARGLGDGLQVFYNFGRNLIQGLINGFVSMYGTLVDAINKYLIDPLKKIPGLSLVVKSPSKWMEENIGRNVVLGIVAGLKRNDELVSAMQNVVDIMQISGPDGSIAAEQFATSFANGLQLAARRTPSLKGLFNAEINTIHINVNDKPTQTISERDNSSAANTVTKILKSAS